MYHVFRGHFVDKHGTFDNKGTVSDKHSSGLVFVKLFRHIVSFSDNKQTQCKF